MHISMPSARTRCGSAQLSAILVASLDLMYNRRTEENSLWQVE